MVVWVREREKDVKSGYAIHLIDSLTKINRRWETKHERKNTKNWHIHVEVSPHNGKYFVLASFKVQEKSPYNTHNAHSTKCLAKHKKLLATDIFFSMLLTSIQN